jgi:hypothetical protein
MPAASRGAAPEEREFHPDGDWVAVTDEIDARLHVNFPEIALDQAWNTEVEVRKHSPRELSVGGNRAEVFEPEIRSVETGQLIEPEQSERKDMTCYVSMPSGEIRHVAPSEYSFSAPRSYSYEFYGRTWSKLYAGEYTLGGKLKLGVRDGEGAQPTFHEVQLPAVPVRVWGPKTDEDLAASTAAAWTDAQGDRIAAWKKCARLVHAGMERRQAEMILPPLPSSGGFGVFVGGCQSSQYWVDPNVMVAICYDYTGSPRNRTGADEREAPLNRVLKVTVEVKPLR